MWVAAAKSQFAHPFSILTFIAATQLVRFSRLSSVGAPQFSPGRKSVGRSRKKSICTSFFDFDFYCSNTTCAILQKIQAVEKPVATQTRKAWEKINAHTRNRSRRFSRDSPSLNCLVLLFAFDSAPRMALCILPKNKKGAPISRSALHFPCGLTAV